MKITISGAVVLCAIIFLSVAVIAVYSNSNPTGSIWFPQCPFRLLTGLSCPACGIQRAVHALLNGRLYDALAYNYFFVVSIPYTFVVCIAFGLRKLHKAECVSELFEHRSLALIYVCCFCVWFVIRNIFGI